MREQSYKLEQSASSSLLKDKAELLGLTKGDGPAQLRVKSYALLAGLALTLSVVPELSAQAATPAPQENKPAQQTRAGAAQAAAARPTAVEQETWRKKMLRIAKPKNGEGCYVATYPETQWREVACKKPPNKLYMPIRPDLIRPETVGGAGPDFSAVVTGHITEAEGSFNPTGTSVTSECAVQCPNQVCPSNPTCTASTGDEYSLQLNSKPFTTTACSGSPTPATCQGWEQFVYSSSGNGFIQYWLLQYGPAGTSCPMPQGASCTPGSSESDGWCPFQFKPTGPVYCVVNAVNSASPPATSATSLAQLKLTGSAAGVNGNVNDAITVTVANTLYPASGNNYFPDLGSQWQEAEFNVFGDGGGDQAVFNSGATIAVDTAVTSGTTSGPACDLQTFTGESNNTTLFNSPPAAVVGPAPALLFSQDDPAPAGAPATCADATSVGDTHLTTFDGVYYDFQASGDFVLAQDGSDFIVQARQASGAPTWPNAAVNKAIATQMGKTRVAVYIEPTRLFIDGALTNLADGKSILLPTGVQVTRQANVYTISDERGNRVRTTLNSTWIDVRTGLGFSPRPAIRGLLGNPGGNSRELVTADGVVLAAPVLFQDLYHTYAESWRVPARESLFTEETAIQFGIPSKPFYANDLTRKQANLAREACIAGGVTNADLLNSCIIDTTVLNDKKSIKVFTQLPPPRYTIKPGAHGKDHDHDHDHKDHDHDRDHDRDRH